MLTKIQRDYINLDDISSLQPRDEIHRDDKHFTIVMNIKGIETTYYYYPEDWYDSSSSLEDARKERDEILNKLTRSDCVI